MVCLVGGLDDDDNDLASWQAKKKRGGREGGWDAMGFGALLVVIADWRDRGERLERGKGGGVVFRWLAPFFSSLSLSRVLSLSLSLSRRLTTIPFLPRA